MSRPFATRVACLVLPGLLAICACGSDDGGGNSVEASSSRALQRIARVENGLLPLLPVRGQPGWNIEERLAYYRVPGVSIAVIDGFQIAWARGYGVADLEAGEAVVPETLFQAASVSKPVTAAAVMTYVQDGRLSLDRPVSELLTSWELAGSKLTRGPVTLRGLLSHTAGITVQGFGGYAPGEELPTLRQTLDGSAPANNEPIRIDVTPGSVFRYSGGGYEIVQQVLEDVTGETFPRLMRQRILDPVGMTMSTFLQPPPPELARRAASGHKLQGTILEERYRIYPEMAATGLWSTPTDLARFGIMLQDAWRGEEGKVLTPASAEAMIEPVMGDAALGLFLERAGSSLYLEHTGANTGFRTNLVLHRRAGYGAVIMANSEGANDLVAEITRAIAREYRWEGYLPEPLKLATLSEPKLQQLAGRYQLDSDTVLVVTAAGDRLKARPTLGEEFELLPTDEETFRRSDRPTIYTFKEDALKLHFNDEKRTAPRIGDSVHVPSELLEQGRFDEALQAYRALRKERPNDAAVAEGRINRAGYEALFRRNVDLAIAIFRINTELYPASANTYDSLGEALLEAGREDDAREAYREVLRRLPVDDKVSPVMRSMLRGLAEKHLEELGDEPGP